MALAMWKKYSVSSKKETVSNIDWNVKISDETNFYSVYTTAMVITNQETGNDAIAGDGYKSVRGQDLGGFVGSYLYVNPNFYMIRAYDSRNKRVTGYMTNILTTYSCGAYIEDVTAEQGTYPASGQSGSYWYVLQPSYSWKKYGLTTVSAIYEFGPSTFTISGHSKVYIYSSVYNSNSTIVGLGEKIVPADEIKNCIGMYMQYGSGTYYRILSISGYTITGAKIGPGATYTKGSYIENITDISSSKYPQNGQQGNYWYIYTGLSNVPPTITGDANEDLGNKNTSFSVLYSVNDVDGSNVLNVIEKLNGNQINSISNAPRNNTFIINITKEILESLPLNQKNTIQISITDGTATTYKTITFTRINSGPSISNLDKDLGQVAREAISEKYICHDVEGNAFTIIEKVDDIELKNIPSVDGTEYTINIPLNIWLALKNGTHTYTITATDSLEASTTRTFTFTKKETVIESTGLTKIISTDIAATKILLTPNWLGKENAEVILFQVCNNAYDDNPTWEDATGQTLLNKPYAFTNKTKTATKWGIDIKFKISLKAEATEGIEFYGLGGAFE